jgi:hypothetical protein
LASLAGSSDEPPRTTRIHRGLPAAFALIAALISWGPPSIGPSTKAPPTVTVAPGATRPAGLAVTDLNDVSQLQARFNADQGVPRLVLALALAPT